MWGVFQRGPIVAVARLALVAAACGSDNKSSTGATTTAKSTGTTATTAGTSTTGGSASTAAAAATGSSGTGPIKIGVLLPLSGPFAAQPYLDVLNAMTKIPGNDKIDGRPVQIISKDDQGNATTGAAATRELLDSDKVDVIIGTNFTAVANAELPLTTDAKKLQLSLSGCPACGAGET